MEIDVYDTYAQSAKGHTIHFDVLVPKGTPADTAYGFAKTWLNSIGENGEGLRQDRCRFCHSEPANADICAAIGKDGHFILQMEGCPSPIA